MLSSVTFLLGYLVSIAFFYRPFLEFHLYIVFILKLVNYKGLCLSVVHLILFEFSECCYCFFIVFSLEINQFFSGMYCCIVFGSNACRMCYKNRVMAMFTSLLDFKLTIFYILHEFYIC